MPLIQRRAFLTGLVSTLAAPAVVRATSIMPVKALIAPKDFAVMSPLNWAALTDVTRKAFVPRLYVRLYDATPLNFCLEE